MKKIKIIALMLMVVLSFGCKKFLDVNHDPNNTETSSVELVFPAGVESTASVMGGSWLMLGEIWSQHWTSQPNAPSFQGEDKYAVQAGDYSYDLRGWESLYTAALMDYEWVKEDAHKNGNWTYYLMATTMQCYTYQVLVDFFDQVPFSDALQKLPAKFDNGQDVYDSLIVRLDYALSKNLEGDSCAAPGVKDLVFGGAMNDWVDFANTLKLKIYLRQRFARPYVAEAGIKKMYEEGVTFLTTDAAFEHFADESGRDNYCYASQFRGRTDVCASKTILDYIKTADKRVSYMFTKVGADYVGMYQGDLNDKVLDGNSGDAFSEPLVSALQPVYFISYVETLFMQSEAALVYSLGDAGSLYKAAIDADFTRKDMEEDDYSPEYVYGDGYGYQDFAGTNEDKLEDIIVQKWIALTNTQGMETFFEHNRTGYPKESPYSPLDDDFEDDYTEGEYTVSITGVLSPPNLFPKRLLLPASEESKNPNFPERKNLNVPVWWDVKDYPY